jgi:hypothetical protein
VVASHLSSAKAVSLSLALATVDDSGAGLNAMIELIPEAMLLF